MKAYLKNLNSKDYYSFVVSVNHGNNLLDHKTVLSSTVEFSEYLKRLTPEMRDIRVVNVINVTTGQVIDRKLSLA